MPDLLATAAKLFTHQFDGVIRVELDGASSFWVDGRQDPPVISEQAPANVENAFCLWRTSRETFMRILSPGVRQIEAAYIAGRLMISGDMAVMARLETGERQAETRS